MKLKVSTKPSRKRPSRSAGRLVAKPSVASPASTGKGDIARAMFARWDKTHRDPKPISWEKLQAILEENRLREAPLFAE